MAGEFEVTRLYAKIVPKLAGNFRLDLQRKINAAVKTAGGAAVKVDLQVNNASIDAAKKKIESRLATTKAKIKVTIDVKSIDRAMRERKTITVNANTSPAERAIRQTFQKIDGSSLLFAKGISDHINKGLKDGFQIPAGASSSIEQHLKSVAREADKTADKVKRDFDRAFKELQRNSTVKINVNDSDVEKLKLANLISRAKEKGIELKVDVDAATAETRLIALTKNRTVELKVDVDKSIVSQANTLLGTFGAGLGNSAKTANGLGDSLQHLGEGFGRVSSVAGAAGAALSGVGKVMGSLLKFAGDAGAETGNFASALGKLGSSVAVAGVLIGVASAVIAVLAALAAATLAVVGFTIAAVILGAIMSAIAVAAGAMAAALAAATTVIGGLVAGIGVAAAALLPVIGAFSEFLNVQQEAPKAAKAATGALQKQTGSLKAASDAAYGVVQAQRQVRNSSENLATAQRSLLRARERLTEAEEKAKLNLIELSRAARDAAGQEEDAETRLIRAQERLSGLDPLDNDSTDYREALRDVERAERDLADTREDNKKKLLDYEKAKKKGIKGDQDVIDARQGVKDAEKGVRNAREAQVDADHALTSAKLGLAAATQRQTAATAAYNTGVDSSTSAQRKLAKQFGDLTASGQKFFDTLKVGYDEVKKLQGIAQDAFLPGLDIALKNVLTLGPIIESAFGTIGKTMGNLAIQFSEVFSSDSGKSAIASLLGSFDKSLSSLGGSLADVVAIMLPAMAQLSEAAEPLVDTLGSGLVTIASGLAELFKSLSKSGTIDGLMSIVNSISTVISTVLVQFGGFISQISGTLTKIGPGMTKGLELFTGGIFDAMAKLINSGLVESFFEFLGQLGTMLSEMADNGFFQELGATMGEALEIIGGALIDLFSDPKVISDFIELFQIIPPLIKQLMSLLPLLLPAFVDFLTASVKLTEYLSPSIIGGIVTALTLFARVLDAVVIAGKAFDWIIETMAIGIGFLQLQGIKLAVNIIAGVIKGLTALWTIVRSFFVHAWEDLVQEIKELLGIASPSKVFAQIGVWILQGLLAGLKSVWNTIKTFFNTAVSFIKGVFGPVWGYLKDKVTVAWSLIKTAIMNSWTYIKNSVFNPMKTFITKTIPDAFRTGVNSIKTFFDKIKEYTRTPVAFVVNTIYNNGIRSLWNNIAGKVGLGQLNKIPGFAKGGKLPGNSGMQYKDDRLAFAGKKAIQLAGGEYVVNAPATAKHLPLLEAINDSGKVGKLRKKRGLLPDGESMPAFGLGGFLGDLWNKGKKNVQGALGKVSSAARGALGLAVTPAIKALRSAVPSVDKSRANFTDMAYAMPNKLLDGVSSFVGKDDKKNALTAGGGNIGGYMKMFNWVKERFPYAQLFSGLRNSRTLSGNPSLHNAGRAIDITPAREILDAIIKTYGGNATELISPWTDTNRWHGKLHPYSKAVQNQHGANGHGNKHIHWAMKLGGLVSGKGGGQSDRILRYLSNGEFVMNSKATAAIGANNLADANKMANLGSSRRQIRGNTSMVNAEFGNSQAPTIIDNTKNFEIELNVQDDHQADLVINKMNALM